MVTDDEVAHPLLSMGGVVVEEKEQLETLGFIPLIPEVTCPCMPKQ